MGRPAKNGRFVNFLMDTDLVDKVDKVAAITGKTKTALFEEALRQYLEPFCNRAGVIAPRNGMYISAGKPCMVLDSIDVGGKKFYKIDFEGDVITVEAFLVSLIYE